MAMIQNLGLALLITTSSDALYETYERLAAIREWGPAVLLDQQIGGGVMWVPGTMMLAIAVLVTAYFWADHEGFRGRQMNLVRELEERSAESGASCTTQGLRNA